MAGSQPFLWRGGPIGVAFAFTIMTFSGIARAQNPPLPNPSPVQAVSDIIESEDVQPPPPPPSFPLPSYYPATAPMVTRVETGLFETISASICGKPDPNTWRPLLFSTLFSEGWNEAWVPSPNGSGGAPRQGWINAMDGNIYRLSFFSFGQAFNSAPRGNAYFGSYTLLAPLSRRLELIVNVPFVVRNNAVSGLPIQNPINSVPPTTSHSGFGDLSFTPRVLLHETKNFSLTSELAVVTPTGNRPLAGKTTTLVPAFGFWSNPGGGWVIRGGLGLAIPLDGSGDNLISQLAVGNTFTDHDVPLFGDFTLYLSTVANTSLKESGRTSVTLTPGLRTHLGNDYYFLAGLPIPVTEQRIGDIGMIFWFMKAW